PWTLTNVPSAGSLSSVSVAGNTATLTIAEGAGPTDTAVGSFTVALATNSAGIRDVNNHLSSFTATAPTDVAAPALVALNLLDNDSNGKVETVTALFSEPLQTYSAATVPWTLTNVPSGGTLSSVASFAAATLTLNLTPGAGAVDTTVGAMTVTMAANILGARDAAGNLSYFAATAPLDQVAPVLVTLSLLDNNGNGRVDTVTALFSETLAGYTAGTTPWTLTNVPAAGTLLSAAAASSTITLTLAEGAGAANTAVGTMTVAMASNILGARDAAGNLASFAATAPLDKVAPVLVTLSLLDNDTDGKIDRVTAVFSETLLTYSAGTTPWALSNVPSGGTLASVSLASPTLTLTLTEGAGAANTAVGTMTVAMASNAGGARDAAGNLASFAATTPLDGARPMAMTITDTNGSINGRAQAGDTISITFSEPLDPASVPGSTTVTLTDPNTTGNDTLTMVGVSNGPRNMGSNTYVTNNNTVASFASSAVTLSNANRTITVTIGSTCSGTGCAGLATQASAVNYRFRAAATLEDVAGNFAVSTVTLTYNAQLF
ncbi:MAG: hypothetical protein M3P52_03275, partial [Actinomycetota bacterium]|nr:hypothetical protein [Actinomycetota bacterium]